MNSMKTIPILYHWCCALFLEVMVRWHLDDDYFSEVAFGYHMRKMEHLKRLKELKG